MSTYRSDKNLERKRIILPAECWDMLQDLADKNNCTRSLAVGFLIERSYKHHFKNK